MARTNNNLPKSQENSCAPMGSQNTGLVTSKSLYHEIKELEEKVLKVKLISMEETVGKTVKEIHTGEVEFWDPVYGILIVFTDDTALFMSDNDVHTSLSFIYRTYWNEHRNEGDAWEAEEIRFFLEFENEEGNPKYVNTDILEEIISKAKELVTLRHQETIKEQIQHKLDEISALKDQL